jgi:hypothetical protein
MEWNGSTTVASEYHYPERQQEIPVSYRTLEAEPEGSTTLISKSAKGRDPDSFVLFTSYCPNIRLSNYLLPKFGGFKPGRSRRIFQGEKILSTPSS